MDHVPTESRRPLIRAVRCRGLLACALLVALAFSTGCKTINPSNKRDWIPEQAVLPYAEIHKHEAQVHNIRNCTYRTADDCTVRHYDRKFDLDKIKSVDFIMVPFSAMPAGAHTFLSFGFEGNEYVAISVEARREKGEVYTATGGLSRQFELMYVIGDERDLIQLRSIYRLDDVYVYRCKSPPADVRKLFVDMLERANKLRKHPEFYDLVTNNCTTNIVAHINHVSPGKIPYTYQVLFPGYSDRLAYDMGLIENDKSFEQVKENARVNELAYINRESPDFSAAIRR